MNTITRIWNSKSANGRFVNFTYLDDEDGEVISLTNTVKWSQEVQDAVTMFSDGEYTADELLDAVNGLTKDIDATAQDVQKQLMPKLTVMSDHITTDGYHVFYDNAEFGQIQLDDALEEHLIRIIQEDGIDGAKSDTDFRSYCRFAERLYGNTDERVRSQFAKWLDKQKWLTFDIDGRLIGYRGVQTGPNGVMQSVHQGPAYVDGNYVNGHVPNPDGSIVSMSRADVENDPSVGCSSGLHVGTYDYAKGWTENGYVLRVAVAPEDVISVPFDCSDQKIRCCRFQVIDHEKVSDESYNEYHDTLTFTDGDDIEELVHDRFDGEGLYRLLDEDGNLLDVVYAYDEGDITDTIQNDDAEDEVHDIVHVEGNNRHDDLDADNSSDSVHVHVNVDDDDDDDIRSVAKYAIKDAYGDTITKVTVSTDADLEDAIRMWNGDLAVLGGGDDVRKPYVPHVGNTIDGSNPMVTGVSTPSVPDLTQHDGERVTITYDAFGSKQTITGTVCASTPNETDSTSVLLFTDLGYRRVYDQQIDTVTFS